MIQCFCHLCFFTKCLQRLKSRASFIPLILCIFASGCSRHKQPTYFFYYYSERYQRHTKLNIRSQGFSCLQRKRYEISWEEEEEEGNPHFLAFFVTFFREIKKVELQLSNGGGLTWIVGCLMLATVSFTIYLNWHIQCFKTKCIFSLE